MPYGFQTIVIPGDFSYTSTVAFAHALRIALATESKLDLAHIADSEACDDGLQQVRKSLALWNLLTENDPPKNRNFFVGCVDASLSFRVSPNVILAPAMHKIGAKKEPQANTRLGFFGVAVGVSGDRIPPSGLMRLR